jgi:hypothetical protein
MVQVKICVYTASRKFVPGSNLMIIDDSESTPGDSRQITEFRSKELPKLAEWLLTHEGPVPEVDDNVRKLGNFKLVSVGSDPKKGYAVFFYDYETKGA